MLDGTRRHDAAGNPEPTGRIKCGTESNGGFEAITITNCIFECCRGLALETVDGANLDDVTVSNLAMRRIFTAPIFLRLGERMRGPDGTPIGRLHHVLISNVVADGVSGGQGILIAGLKGNPVEDVTLDNIQIGFAGGGGAELAQRLVPELERKYPEPGTFGPTPSWALYARHAANLTVRNVEFRVATPDARAPVWLEDVSGVEFDHLKAPAAGQVFALKDVQGLVTQSCSGTPDSPR